MNSLGFVARASLREAGCYDPAEVAAMQAADEAYVNTLMLLERAEEESRLRRAGKYALGAGAAYAGGMGALGAGRALYHGASLANAGRSALAHISSPVRVARGLGLRAQRWYYGAPKAGGAGGYQQGAMDKSRAIAANVAADKRAAALAASELGPDGSAYSHALPPTPASTPNYMRNWQMTQRFRKQGGVRGSMRSQTGKLKTHSMPGEYTRRPKSDVRRNVAVSNEMESARYEAFNRLLEAESRNRSRLKKAAMIGAAGLGAYGLGAGGLGAYRAWGKTPAEVMRSAGAHIMAPRALTMQAYRALQKRYYGKDYGASIMRGKGSPVVLPHGKTPNPIYGD